VARAETPDRGVIRVLDNLSSVLQLDPVERMQLFQLALR
jgi:hypothetical protein